MDGSAMKISQSASSTWYQGFEINLPTRLI